MGRSGGGPSQWRRWHDLGGRVLALVCQQTRQQPSSFSLKGSFSLSSVRERLSAAPCEARVHKSCFWPSHSIASKCGIVGVKGKVGSVSSLHHGKQRHVFSERSFSTAIQYPSRNAISVGNGGPNPLQAVEDRSMAANSKTNCCSQSWLHRSGLLDVQNCGLTRSISTANTAGYQGRAEQPSIEIVDQELAYPIFPSHNNWPTSAKSVRRGGVGMSNAILDTGMDMSFMSRASKLPLHSALPSLRTHRLGEATLLGLQGFEAAASMPAGDVVDWKQQRLGRLKDYDPRPRPQHSSPHSDAEPDDIFIPVKAFYISRSVDLKSLAREPFLEVTSSRNNLIIRCADRPPHSPVTADNPEMACLGFLKERYMVAFQYGSVVFFNFGDHEEVEFLDVVRKYCSDEFWEARKDDYGVLVRHTLAEWSEGGHDQVMLRKLDIDNIRVISSILGQSIALDHYAKKVDEMVTTFSELNRGMEQTGTFTMTRKSLFQLVAAANTTLADVILRLGLLERSDAAWKDANYAQIWEYLRDDFELDERFESLDFKLNIIQHNVRFFLEILQNRKSDTLEWIIILLITGEICVSLYEILHTAGAI